MNKWLFLCVTVPVLSACGDNTPVQTVDWYKQHDAERKAVVAQCNNNPGEKAQTPNCINARQADNEKSLARTGWLDLRAPDASKKEQ